LDFGVSKFVSPKAPSLTGSGASLGTPGYMSPEQARGEAKIDARSDVFSVACVLYECLAGEPAFRAPSYHETVAAVLERTPAPLADVPTELSSVLMRALSKERAARYAHAGEMAAAIHGAVQLRPALASTARGAMASASTFVFETPQAFPASATMVPVGSVVSPRADRRGFELRRGSAWALAVALVGVVAASVAFVGSRRRSSEASPAHARVATDDRGVGMPAPVVSAPSATPLRVVTRVTAAEAEAPSEGRRAGDGPVRTASDTLREASSAAPSAAPPKKRGRAVKEPDF
jgi:serine/threonine-protein kinase